MAPQCDVIRSTDETTVRRAGPRAVHRPSSVASLPRRRNRQAFGSRAIIPRPSSPLGDPPAAPGRYRGDVTREHGRVHGVTARVRGLVRAIEENDEARIEDAVLRLSRRRRALAPLAFMVGALALLFEGVRLLVSNWRLTLIQIPPAMWIWLATADLKAHVLRGRSLNVIRGPILIPLILAITAITMVAFFLNAVFALAVARPGGPDIHAGRRAARERRVPVLASGAVVGLALGVATTVVPRWGRPWFGIVLSVVVGVMMFSYVFVPARLIGARQSSSRRDKLMTSVVGGVIGATVCTPPYLLGRLGILMLGSKALFVPGIVVLAVGATLQAGATGAVRAIKMSATLAGARRPSDPAESDAPPATARRG
jgi:hypothetical protein